MADDEIGEERDPLLVRPFVLRDSPAPEPDEPDAAQTWPAATTREVRSHRALDGTNDPTAVSRLPQAHRRRPRGRRRLAVLAAAAGVVVIGAGAAGYAALRDDVRPSLTTSLPGDLPAATAPAPTATASSTSGDASSSAAMVGAGPSTPGTTSGRASSRATSAATTAPTTATTTEAPAPLVSSPAGDGRTATPGAPEAIAPNPPATDRIGLIRGQNGVCLDLNGGVSFDGNHVQVYDCNGSGAQLWSLASDGTLRVAGKCALVEGDNTVHIVGCDGRTTAQWSVAGQRLINAANSRCLTDPSGGSRSGTGVTVTECDGSAKQRWSLP